MCVPFVVVVERCVMVVGVCLLCVVWFVANVVSCCCYSASFVVV